MPKIFSKYIFAVAIAVILLPYMSFSDNTKKVLFTVAGVFLIYIYFKTLPKKAAVRNSTSHTESHPNIEEKVESNRTNQWQDIKRS